MDWDLILSALTAVLIKLPLYLTWLIGIVFIIVYSKQKGRNARDFLIIVVGIFFIDMIGMVFNSVTYIQLRRSEFDIETIAYIISGINLIFNIIQSVLWGFLFYLFLAETRPKTENEN